MGIVQNQTFKNTITTYLGFGIGAINVLYFFPNYLSDEYFGLVAFILSSANIMMPLFALGTQNTIVKFYSSFKTRNSINSFLTLMLVFPLLLIIPVGTIGWLSYELISDLLSTTNPIIKDYVWLIFVSATCFAYFEIFYAWAKVQMQSVFGNFMKEVFPRLGVLALFISIHFNFISFGTFIYGVVFVYIIRTVIMMLYAFNVKSPVLRMGKIPNLSEIIKYSLLIVVAGSVGSIILEIDKVMIGELKAIENVAYYAVAIYIASVVGVPGRSMLQITNPITAKLLNDKDMIGLDMLYKKSSLNLLIIGGLIFLLIVLNINQLYELIPEKFGGGLLVVFIVGIAKLADNIAGNSNAILFNSDYYRIVLILGILLAVTTVVLNVMLIPKHGINGAAFATFISIIAYNASKLLFVYFKFKMSPFTLNTIKTLVLILVLIVAFYFWDFGFHPILNIALKSILVGLIYVVVTYALTLSEDISSIINKLLKR
ncbi:MAG: sugar isomerase [Bacteroidetes bacterium]|nr:MAG: sugar isomerase [Bacteroidota bacterium]